MAHCVTQRGPALWPSTCLYYKRNSSILSLLYSEKSTLWLWMAPSNNLTPLWALHVNKEIKKQRLHPAILATVVVMEH